MKVQDAMRLQVGDKVSCPADRGSDAYIGIVTHNVNSAATINKNCAGDDYIWIEVKGLNHKTVWPSNRLSKN